ARRCGSGPRSPCRRGARGARRRPRRGDGERGDARAAASPCARPSAARRRRDRARTRARRGRRGRQRPCGGRDAVTAVEAHELFRVHGSGRAGVPALQGLSLEVEEGEVCAVLGPSGSGKSTFLRLVAGLDVPSAGALRVLGREPSALGRRELARFRREELGYLDQRYWLALAPRLSALELVGLHGALAGDAPAARRERAVELLGRVGLAGREESPATELSGGEQQRVALCA